MPKNAKSTPQPKGAGKRAKPQRSHSLQAKVRALLPLLRVHGKMALGEQAVIFLSSGAELSRFDELVRHRASQVGVSGRTLYRWLKRFEESGERGLKKAPRRDKNLFQMFRNFPGVAALVLLKHAEGCSTSAIYKELVRELPNLHPGKRVPSCAGLGLFIKSLASAVLKIEIQRAQQVRE